MALVIFWIKIAIKRILAFFKHSPVLLIWLVLIIGAFIYTIAKKYFTITLDTGTLFMVIPFFMLCSLFNSFKNYYLMPILIAYSKSKFKNDMIYIRFFIKQAFTNNILLIIFNIFAYYTILDKIYLFVIPIITVFSIILSFLIMYIKNNYTSIKTTKTSAKKIKISPVMKSIIYDYLTPNFLTIVVLCITFFAVVIIEFTKDIKFLCETVNQIDFFSMIPTIFSIGFMGIYDSTSNINWKYQAIISPNNFKYHIKRTMLFLTVFFGWLLLIFIFIGGIINLTLLLKCLYCIFALFLINVHISLTVSHIIIKSLLSLLVIALTIWLNTLPVALLLILLIPVINAILKAKNEYKEWFLS